MTRVQTLVPLLAMVLLAGLAACDDAGQQGGGSSPAETSPPAQSSPPATPPAR
jgi:hypothetical protein